MLYSVKAMKLLMTAITISFIVHSILFVKLNYDKSPNNELKVSIKLNRLKSLNPNLVKVPTSDIDLPLKTKSKEELNPHSNARKSVNKDNLNSYLNSLAIYLQNKIQYPHKAKQLRQEGVVITELEINSKGNLLNFKLTKVAKHTYLNKHVKLILNNIIKLPKPPKDLSSSGSIKINVPIEFKL